MSALLLRKYSSGYLFNYDEAIFGVQNFSLNVFWEYSPYSMKLASDWLRVDSSPVEKEGKK